jgi:hypothetical protein
MRNLEGVVPSRQQALEQVENPLRQVLGVAVKSDMMSVLDPTVSRSRGSLAVTKCRHARLSLRHCHF